MFVYRASSFNQTDFYAMFASKAASPRHAGAAFPQGSGGDDFSLQSSKGPTPRTSNFDEEMIFKQQQLQLQQQGVSVGKRRMGRSMSGELYHGGGSLPPYPPPNPMIAGPTSSGGVGGRRREGSGNPPTPPNKELHMFVWSSSQSPVSEHIKNTNAMNNNVRGGTADLGILDSSKAVLQQEIAAARGMLWGYALQ